MAGQQSVECEKKMKLKHACKEKKKACKNMFFLRYNQKS